MSDTAKSVKRIHVIQASYGDAFLLEFSDKSWWLIDGGPADGKRIGIWKKTGYSLFATLNNLEVPEIELMVVTHNDHDHTCGIIALLSSLEGAESSTRSEDGNNQNNQSVKLEYTHWKKGYELLHNSATKRFPIRNVWYNDMGILLEKLGGEKNSKGWALEALEKFRKLGDINSLPALDLVKQDPSKSLNKEFNVYLIAPTDNELQKLVKEKNKGLTQGWLGNWKKKTIAGTEEVEKNVKASKKWFNKNKKTSRDKSVYNLSSIVFKIPGTEGGILLTGDSTGPILDDYYDQKSKSFRVMKIMHHGSSANCYLNSRTTSKSGQPMKEIQQNNNKNSHFLMGCIRFFVEYYAHVYIISADGFSRVPNPDGVTIRAIAEAHETVHRFAPHIYLTNGCTYEQMMDMMYEYDEQGRSERRRKCAPTVWFLNRGNDETNDCDFGTITLNNESKYGETGESWGKIQNEDCVLRYHIRYNPYAFFSCINNPGEIKYFDWDGFVKKGDFVEVINEFKTTYGGPIFRGKGSMKRSSTSTENTTIKRGKQSKCPDQEKYSIHPNLPNIPESGYFTIQSSPVPQALIIIYLLRKFEHIKARFDSVWRSFRSYLPLLMDQLKRIPPIHILKNILRPTQQIPTMLSSWEEPTGQELWPFLTDSLTNYAIDHDPPILVQFENNSAFSSNFIEGHDFAIPMPPLNTMNTRSTPTQQVPTNLSTWRELMIAELNPQDLLDMRDILDGPTPTATDISVSQSTNQWVDLVGFVEIFHSTLTVLETSPLKSVRSLYDSLKEANNTKNPSIPLLAVPFLALFLDLKTLDHLLVQIPLNFDGRSRDKINLDEGPGGVPAIAFLTLYKFRALIRPRNSDIEILALNFELGPPPNHHLEEEFRGFWQWHIPVENHHWSQGDITLQHRGNLRARILNLEQVNPLTILHFNSTVSVRRSRLNVNARESEPLAIKGKMIVKSNEGAIYDLRFVGDSNGTVSILDMLKLWSPFGAAVSMNKMFSSSIENLTVPGLDLGELLTESLRLKDCGIILRQYFPWFVAVSIDELYGTVQTSKTISLALNALNLPYEFRRSIPQSLPNLTIRILKLGSKHSQIALAFGFEVENVGTTVLEASIASNASPRFDLWGMCDDHISLRNLLHFIEYGNLTNDFEAAKIFCNALSHITIPYIRITVAKDVPYDKQEGKYGVKQIAFRLDINDFQIPNAENPIIDMENIQIHLEHQSPTKPGDIRTIKINGKATFQILQIDTLLEFSYDYAGDALKQASELYFDTEKANARSNTSQQEIRLDFRFPNEAPSFKTILLRMCSGTDIQNEMQNGLPDIMVRIFLGILDLVAFREVAATVSRPMPTDPHNITDQSSKWAISRLFMEVELGGELINILNNALEGKLALTKPIVTFDITDPSSKETRIWDIYLSAKMVLGGILTKVHAAFLKPPADHDVARSEFNLTIDCVLTGGPGIPLGHVVQHFADTALEGLGLNPKEAFSEGLRNLVESVDVRLINITIGNVSDDPGKSSYKLKQLEVIIEAAAEPIMIFENFALSDVVLHFVHRTGHFPELPDAGLESSASLYESGTSIHLQGAINTKCGKLITEVTHSTGTGAWTMSLAETNTEGLDMISLAQDFVQEIADFEIPSTIQAEVKSILKLNIKSFSVGYEPAKKLPNGENQPQSFCLAQQGEISLFGLGTKSINVICERPNATSKWNWTVALALPTPCYPFKCILHGISGTGLDAIAIRDGYIAFAKGTPSRKISKTDSSDSDNRELSIMLSGTIVFEDDEFFKFIGNIVNLKQIHFMVAIPSTQIEMSIPSSSALEILQNITIKSYHLRFSEPSTLSLGSGFIISPGWLGKNEVKSTLSVTVDADGSFGGEVSIADNIEEPFGLKSIFLEKSKFSLIWLATASAPKLFEITTGVRFNIPGVDEMSASLSGKLDLSNPLRPDGHLIIDVKNLTLANVVKVFTNRKSLPTPLDSPNFNIGFKELKVKVVPPASSDMEISLDAIFYFFFLRGQVAAKVNLSGISFSANLEPVNILGIIKLTDYSENNGPFVYLNTTVQSLQSGKGGPPDWLKTQTGNDPRLKNAFFALNARLAFFGVSLAAYGYITPNGMMLEAEAEGKIDCGDVAIEAGTGFSLEITNRSVEAKTTLHFSFGLNHSSFSIAGVNFGNLEGMISFDASVTIKAGFVDNSFSSSSLSFEVAFAARILGAELNGTVRLDIPITHISDLAGAVLRFIKRELDKIFKRPLEAVNRALDDARGWIKYNVENLTKDLRTTFNACAEDVALLFHSLGFPLTQIASLLKSEFDLAMHEIEQTFRQIGAQTEAIVEALAETFRDVEHFTENLAKDTTKMIEDAEEAIGHEVEVIGHEVEVVGHEVEVIGHEVADFVVHNPVVDLVAQVPSIEVGVENVAAEISSVFRSWF